MKYKFLSVIVCLLILTLSVSAQSQQAAFLEAKRLYKNGDYLSAQNAFGALTIDPVFGEYSAFYFGLSAYQLGRYKVAGDMWSQLIANSPDWNKIDEVFYWQAYMNLEQSNFENGVKFGHQLALLSQSDSLTSLLYKKFVAVLPVEKVASLYEVEPHLTLAKVYYAKLKSIPYLDRDEEKIVYLEQKWGFGAGVIKSEFPTIKRSVYKVAVMLPFMYDTAAMELIYQNSLVMSLYQGIALAAEDLRSKGVKIDLLVYDTKRSEKITQQILSNLPEDIDLIIGPLYAEPINLTKKFSLEKQVNMINPVSSNYDVIEDNPFAFLLNPSSVTMGSAMADYAIKHLQEKKNAMIFYESNSKDSLLAYEYRFAIESAGFNVKWMKSLNATNAKEVLDELIKEYDIHYTKYQADSVNRISHRFVKSRRLRYGEANNLVYREGYSGKAAMPVSIDGGGHQITYYETRLKIASDSIGHILGATRKNYMANNLISAVETMRDKVILLGYGEWVEFNMVSLEQLERIGVTMAFTDYIDYKSEKFLVFAEKIRSNLKVEPNHFHAMGYETMFQVGNWMKSAGRYFQNEIRKGAFYEGEVLQGFQYGAHNDNQVVPILKFIESKLEIVNE